MHGMAACGAAVQDVAGRKGLAYEKLRDTLGSIPSEAVKGVEFEALSPATGAEVRGGGGGGEGGREGGD